MMKMKFEELEATLNTLESVARNYPVDSIEYKSIRFSARALLFIYTENHVQMFTEYIQDTGKPITPEHMKNLDEKIVLKASRKNTD